MAAPVKGTRCELCGHVTCVASVTNVKWDQKAQGQKSGSGSAVQCWQWTVQELGLDDEVVCESRSIVTHSEYSVFSHVEQHIF